jgi:hypothetical protein
MLPIKNGSTSPCSNISSNCVLWQGPDIPCIGLCNGDTVSDVIAKLAEKLCNLLDAGSPDIDLSGLDLACVLPEGSKAPDALQDVIQLIIDYVCDIEGGTTSREIGPIQLCDELIYEDPATGLDVTQLFLEDYAILLGAKICDIIESIDIINLTLLDYGTRITVLEECVLPCTDSTTEVDVVSSCILPDLRSVPHSTLTLALETRFCDLETAVGTPPLIVNAVNTAGCITGSNSTLSQTSTYGSNPDWINTPSTLAHTVQNAWVVICDMYAAIQDIQLNCCPGGCDSIVFDYSASVNTDGAGVATSISLLFRDTSIGSGFNDCDGSTTVTLTDINGATKTSAISVTALAGTTTASVIPISPLSPYGNITIEVPFCVEDETNECNETKIITLPIGVNCPTNIAAENVTATDVNVTFTNVLGSTASYVIDILKDGLVVQTRTINSPGGSVNELFTGLDSNDGYTIRVTTSISGQSTICDQVPFVTLSDEPPCDSGIDIAILMDYTSSMRTNIEAAKSGVNSLISTVTLASAPNAYRMGLVIVDEYGNDALPTYAANTEYTSLPSSQKYVNTATTPNSDIYITAMEMFGTNNGATFGTQLFKLANTLPLGSGNFGAEPMDRALDLVVNNNFLGAFRNDIAKYIVIITDAEPSGLDDLYNAPGEDDDAFVAALETVCINQGIKVFVLGSGAVNQVYKDLAINTGGTWNTSFNSTSIEDAITDACGELT